MGDPRRTRKTYSRPMMIWNESLLKNDNEINREYKLKNKKELWKVSSYLQNIKDQTKNITSRLGTAHKEQALKEQQQLFEKVKRYGLIKKETITRGDLLNLSIRDVLERRLQTIVYRRGLARSVSQARQFIVHGHITVGDKKMTSPSYLVTVDEEDTIAFVEKSSLNDPIHPERADVDPNIVIKHKEEKKTEESQDSSDIEKIDEKKETDTSEEKESSKEKKE